MGTIIKHLGLSAFLAMGSLFPPRGTPIIGYHSIADDNSYISLAPEMFAVQMRYLHDAGYRVVSFDRFITCIDETGVLPDRTMVLTFDDGLKDFYTAAWPVLRQFDFSATVFVPTDYIGDKSRWYADYGLAPVAMLGWEEIRKLAASGIDIQSHGCSHRPLSALPPTELEAEVVRSRRVLEAGLGKPVDLFCCPQGADNPRVAAAIKAAGYRAGIAGGDGLFNLHDDRFRIKRQLLDYIAINDEKTALLGIKSCTRGTFAWYVKTKKRIKHYGHL
jgi:peptidoglycan/xylan/chitin deacetylase (PgdA/CDA1 family)